jgi:hypothetical protein
MGMNLTPGLKIMITNCEKRVDKELYGLDIGGSVDRTIAQIEACKTADEVFAVVTAFLQEARTTRGAFRTLSCPLPIRSLHDVRTWSRVLRSTVQPQSESADLLGEAFAVVRAASRKLDAIE